MFVYQGSTSGLDPWHGVSQHGIGTNENGDWFGSELATGDFDGDGLDDLAVGAPGEKVGDIRSGFVFVYQGYTSGLDPWHGVSQHGIGTNEDGDLFGYALGTGDFDGDGLDDLAVGTPGENNKSGFVFAFKGSNFGLNPWKALSQRGIGTDEVGDRFGNELVVGDFNDDGLDDIVVSVPYEDIGSIKDAGYAYVFRGSNSDLLNWTTFGPQKDIDVKLIQEPQPQPQPKPQPKPKPKPKPEPQPKPETQPTGTLGGVYTLDIIGRQSFKMSVTYSGSLIKASGGATSGKTSFSVTESSFVSSSGIAARFSVSGLKPGRWKVTAFPIGAGGPKTCEVNVPGFITLSVKGGKGGSCSSF